jgi:hypothetical protein
MSGAADRMAERVRALDAQVETLAAVMLRLECASLAELDRTREDVTAEEWRVIRAGEAVRTELGMEPLYR